MGRIVRDVEDLSRNIIEVFQANLNTQIGLLNTQKAANNNTDDDFSIEDIQADAWFLSQVPTVWSHPCFVVWGLTRNQLSAQQDDNAIRNVGFFFEVVIPDEGDIDRQATFYKLLRYGRALERVVHKNVDKIQRGMKFQIDSLIPASADFAGKKFMSGGISVTTNISTD